MTGVVDKYWHIKRGVEKWQVRTVLEQLDSILASSITITSVERRILSEAGIYINRALKEMRQKGDTTIENNNPAA